MFAVASMERRVTEAQVLRCPGADLSVIKEFCEKTESPKLMWVSWAEGGVFVL